MRGREGEDAPVTWHALELVHSAFVELESGADDEVAQCAGDEDFAWPGQVADACANVYRDAADVVAAEFAFAAVESRSNFKAER